MQMAPLEEPSTKQNKRKRMRKGLAKHGFSFLVCLLVMVAAAVHKERKLMGYELTSQQPNGKTTQTPDTMRTLADGRVVIYTAPLAKDVQGYAGPVPLEIYLKEGKVQKVVALENSETPDFFEMAAELLPLWQGKTTEEALNMQVDAVSGATFSSKALIAAVQRGLQYAQKKAHRPSLWQQIDRSPAALAALVVVLLGAIVPLFSRNKRYRTAQKVLNVVVLGFWMGTFISYSLIVSYVSNGVNLWTALVPVVMLITAFIYPFFGKKNYYCTHLCPCGSLQDLTGKIHHRKWKIGLRTERRLERFRKWLWGVLMLLLITNVWASWMNYEMFVAFILQSASWIVIVWALLFIVLSVWVPRPYCRFVCPTGTLFKLAQKIK